MKFLSVILSFVFAFVIGDVATSQIAPDAHNILGLGFGLVSAAYSFMPQISGLAAAATIVTLDRDAAARALLESKGVSPNNIQVGKLRTIVQLIPGQNSYNLTINELSSGSNIKYIETRLKSSDAFIVTKWCANFRQVAVGGNLQNSYENQNPNSTYFTVANVLSAARAIWSGKATMKVNQNPVIIDYPLSDFDIVNNQQTNNGKWRDVVQNILLTGSSTNNTITLVTNGDTSGFPSPVAGSDEGVWIEFELSGILIPSGASTVEVTQLMDTLSGNPTR